MRFVVVGIGSIGRWVAESLAEHHSVFAYDVDQSQYELLQRVRPVLSLSDIADLSPDCVLCATPLQTTDQVLLQLNSLLPTNVALGDVASIKWRPQSAYRQMSRKFVSIHPMFGPTFTNMTDLVNHELIMIEESNSELLEVFADICARHQIITRSLSFAEHDELMLSSLLTPYLCSLLFLKLPKDPQAPGTSFARHHQLARSIFRNTPEFLAEVFSTQNANVIFERARSVITEIESLTPIQLTQYLTDHLRCG